MKKSLLIAILILNISTLNAAVFKAEDYGVKGDGITDDGPAIQTAIAAVIAATGSNSLVFQADKQFYVSNIADVYLFDLINTFDIEINANGSEFLLDAHVRFIRTHLSENIHLKNLSIDYKSLPFFEGTVIEKNQSAKYIDVQISPEFEMPPLGGPTNSEDEQAYFGLSWYDGPNSLMASHYYVTDMQEIYAGSSNDKKVRVTTNDHFSGWNKITENTTIVSLPVRGIAHIGAEEVLLVLESTDVYFENINVWSAPWFVFGLTRSKGEIVLKNIRIKPKDGTNRILSSWRDGIHVKSNYAKLLFENCYLEGMGDDAFNTATFMSTVKSVTNHQQIVINQVFPLQIVPYNEGDVVVVYDVVKGKLLGRSKVKASIGFYQSETPQRPNITVAFETPVIGMNTGCVVWNESSANPNTTLIGCTILQSCRFQSSVTIDRCDIKALSWFRCQNIEGPMSTNVIVKNSKLARGRGNENTSVVFSNYMSHQGTVYPSTEPPLYNILFQNNEIDGNFNLEYCNHVSVINNTFSPSSTIISLKKSKDMLFRDNKFGRVFLDNKNQINFRDTYSEDNTTIEISENPEELNIMQPFAEWTAVQNGETTYRYHSLPDAYKPQNKTEIGLGDSSYSAYQIVLPPSSSGISEIKLNEYPTTANSNIHFWSYNGGSKGSIEAKAIDHNKNNTTIYSVALNDEEFQKHNIVIPENLNEQSGKIVISFKATDNAASAQTIYIGNSPATGDILALALMSDEDVFRVYPNPVGNSDITIELAKGTTYANIKIYNVLGGLVYNKEHNNTADVLVSSKIFKGNGLYIVSVQIASQHLTKKLIVNK